jgi:hypothetical protein
MDAGFSPPNPNPITTNVGEPFQARKSADIVGEPFHLTIAGRSPLPQGIMNIVGEPFQARKSADIVGEPFQARKSRVETRSHCY